MEAKRKPRRNSINGTRNVLTVKGKDSNFEYRVVNDTGDRVAQFVENGWEVVKDSGVQIGDRRIANPTKEGSVVTTSVGGGTQGILMRIRKDWYDEDQTSKQSYVNETEQAMKKDALKSADYGKIEVSS